MLKRIVLLALLLSMLALSTGAEQSRKNVLLSEEALQKRQYEFISVSPFDEVAVGFRYGIVYLYDKDGAFLSGYDFQVTSGSMYGVFFHDNATIDCYFSRSKKVRRYDRQGNLLKEFSVSDRAPIEVIRSMKSVDSRGVKYEARKGELFKIHPDGKEEILCELSSENRSSTAAVLVVAAFASFVVLKKLKR